MSDATYCREDCRFCAYREGRWELALAVPVMGEYEEGGVLAVMVHPATNIVACPSCGTALLPNGETAEMARRSVAVRAIEGVAGSDGCYGCPAQDGACAWTFNGCGERLLAWAERQGKEAGNAE